MRGVQKCTCAGASLRGRNSAPLCCIKLDTATDPACGSGGMFIQSAELVKSKQGNLNGINIYGQEKEPAT
jgi:type I restriction enzyme M protein